MRLISYKWFRNVYDNDDALSLAGFMGRLDDALNQEGWQVVWLDELDDRLTLGKRCEECRVPFATDDECVVRLKDCKVLVCIECGHQMFCTDLEIPEVLR
jgi:hypothetical protein